MAKKFWIVTYSYPNGDPQEDAWIKTAPTVTRAEVLYHAQKNAPVRSYIDTIRTAVERITLWDCKNLWHKAANDYLPR